MNKNDLRGAHKKLRAALPEKYRKTASREICNRILQLAEFKTAKTVAAYYPFGAEVDVSLLFDEIMREKTLLLPVTYPHGDMVFKQITSISQLEKSTWGIMQPASLCRKADFGEIDFMLVPAVCADRRKNRIGYGGGYYDRAAEKVKKSCVRCGVIFKSQLEDEIPTEPHDAVLTKIIFDGGDI